MDAVTVSPKYQVDAMSIIDRNVTVTMCRETLTRIPLYPLPPGHQIRAYLPGDEHEWVRIESTADRFNTITIELFRREFGDDPTLLAERQFFLLDRRGGVIGTATAWFDDNHHGHRYGRIHWVAIHPDWQGQGMSKPLLTRVCSRLHELGHDKAYLVTSTGRINAINLYLQYGFLPEINGAEDERVWDQVKGHMNELLEAPGRIL